MRNQARAVMIGAILWLGLMAGLANGRGWLVECINHAWLWHARGSRCPMNT